MRIYAHLRATALKIDLGRRMEEKQAPHSGLSGNWQYDEQRRLQAFLRNGNEDNNLRRREAQKKIKKHCHGLPLTATIFHVFRRKYLSNNGLRTCQNISKFLVMAAFWQQKRAFLSRKRPQTAWKRSEQTKNMTEIKDNSTL